MQREQHAYITKRKKYQRVFYYIQENINLLIKIFSRGKIVEDEGKEISMEYTLEKVFDYGERL